MLEITPDLSLPDDELIERFVRSSGPGGQNVNKVATAVELRFDVAGSPSLPEPVRARLLAKRDRRRTQDRNREDARERLKAFIESGLHVPKPRIATRPSRASKQRRLDEKRGRSTIKQGRTRRDWD